MRTADKQIADILLRYGEPFGGNVWRVQGTVVIYHRTLERIAAQGTLYLKAFAQMYGDIFLATVVICIAGALLGLLLGGRKEHAEEPEIPEPEAVSLGER